jgi:3-hydroxy-9,10-secoandrosta-1,3,5(10)-triene-9,17-dione monooxygenase
MSKIETAELNIPSAEEIVQRAHDMIPMLRARAEECEKNRMVSKETIQAFKDAGFSRYSSPSAGAAMK